MIKSLNEFRYFESQESGEKVLIVNRKHWLYLVTPVIVGLLLVIFFAALLFLIKMPAFGGDKIEASAAETVFALASLYVATYAYNSWLTRYYNIVILTDEHLVEVEQLALFSRRVSVLDLDHIEDVSFSQQGLLQTLLSFGDLEIQTAGEMRNFIFKDIVRPDDLQKKIMELKELEESERASSGKVYNN